MFCEIIMGKIQQFAIKAMYSAEDSVSFIKKKRDSGGKSE